MFKRSVLFLLGAFLLIGAIVFVKVSQVRAALAQDYTPPPVSIVSAVATQETWEQSLQAIGTLTAVQGITIETELDGKVVEIAFESGAQVREGDLLLRQDTSAEEAQLADAEASSVLSRINYERARDLREQGANSQAEFDTARAALASAEARVAAIKASIEKKTLRAPFSGRLGIRAVNFGQFLRGGQAVVPLFSFDPIYVDFSLPQQHLTALRVGQVVKLSIDAFEGESFEGRLTAINPQVDTATRNVQIQATLANADGRLRPGMFAKAQVVNPEVQHYVTLPNEDGKLAADTLTATGYNLVRVGERSGQLPGMLESLAKLCQDNGRTRMKQFLALLEPLAILLIGSAIGVIMIGIILAITSANDIAV